MANDRRAAAANRRLDQDMAGRRSVSADAYMAGVSERLRFEHNSPRIESGIIVDVVPGAYCYLVCAGRESFLWCTPAGTTAGFGALGGRPLTTFVIGTPIYFIRHPDTPSEGRIVAAAPHWSDHTGNQPADTIWPFARTGQQVESAHQYPLLFSAASAGALPNPLVSLDVVDFSAGRPPEATAVGEWGVIMETGVGVFADPFQAYLRVSERTGVFVFYPDEMLRVAGHNYQHFTSLKEEEHLEDEGELAGFTRGTVYPHENLGLWRHNQVTPGWSSSAVTDHGLAPGQGVKFHNPYDSASGSGFAVREPEYVAQITAARLFGWSGYLGQGGMSQVAGPAQLDWAYPSLSPSAATATVAATSQSNAPSGRMTVNAAAGPASQPLAVPPNTRGGPDQPGLFEEHTEVTGLHTWRSAKGFLLTKRPSIPNPRPVRRPEDPAGDNAGGGYDPSGLNGTHAVSGELALPTGVPNRTVIFPDVVAYAFNWANLVPFIYHTEDWAVAEEGAAGSDLVNQQAPDYADLAAQQYLDAPTPLYLDVDHRYGLVRYYENESGIAFLDDGSVVLYDGWGSEIRMGGGNIEFRCAGDVALYPGRDVIAWAGHDLDLKAHDTIDAAAVNGDVFLRSQNKFHAVSGNSGFGGFLFENKAICPLYDFDGKTGAATVSSGFTFLAPNAAFVVQTQDVALTLADTSSTGRIFLDAGNSRHVYTRSKTFVNRISPEGSVVHLFDGSSGESANEFAEDYTFIGSRLAVQGGGHFTSCLSSSDWIMAGQHFSSDRANEFSGEVAQHETENGSTDAQITARKAYLTDTYGPAFVSQAVTPPGFEDAEFTHRTSSQYRTEDFVYWESRWQTLASGQTLWDWAETPVVGLRSSSETFAHPGERRAESGSYKYVEPTLVDTGNGWVGVNRTTSRGDYEAAETADPTSTSLDDAYAITTPAG